MLDLSHAVEFLSCSNDVTLRPMCYKFSPPVTTKFFYTKFFLVKYFQHEYFPIYGIQLNHTVAGEVPMMLSPYKLYIHT